METGAAKFHPAFHLFCRSDRAPGDARARQSQSRYLLRPQEIQRQRSLLRESSGEIRARVVGVVVATRRRGSIVRYLGLTPDDPGEDVSAKRVAVRWSD